MSGSIITISQQKGGSGKTTLAAHLAVAWTARHAKRVALLDVDPALARELLNILAANGAAAGAK